MVKRESMVYYNILLLLLPIAKVRQLLYEGCSEDQYSRLLEQNGLSRVKVVAMYSDYGDKFQLNSRVTRTSHPLLVIPMVC